MSEKTEISINNSNFQVFNIKKYKIDHLPYSLRVLMENYLRNSTARVIIYFRKIIL